MTEREKEKMELDVLISKKECTKSVARLMGHRVWSFDDEKELRLLKRISKLLGDEDGREHTYNQ